MICQVNGAGDLLDFYGDRLTSIGDVVQDITNVSTLNKKPKLLMIQAYAGTWPSGIFKTMFFVIVTNF